MLTEACTFGARLGESFDLERIRLAASTPRPLLALLVGVTAMLIGGAAMVIAGVAARIMVGVGARLVVGVMAKPVVGVMAKPVVGVGARLGLEVVARLVDVAGRPPGEVWRGRVSPAAAEALGAKARVPGAACAPCCFPSPPGPAPISFLAVGEFLVGESSIPR